MADAPAELDAPPGVTDAVAAGRRLAAAKKLLAEFDQRVAEANRDARAEPDWPMVANRLAGALEAVIGIAETSRADRSKTVALNTELAECLEVAISVIGAAA